MADRDNMDRVTTQTSSQALRTIDQAFQTLGRAFGFLWRLKNLVRMFEKLDQKFERFRKLVLKKHSDESFSQGAR